MEPEEKIKWDARYKERPEAWLEPDEFLVRAYDQFLQSQPAGLALDLAGGAGRNSTYLLERGWNVVLMDISEVALGLAREKAHSLEDRMAQPPSAVALGSLHTEHADLNAVSDLGTDRYDLIIAFYFLRRELFPALISALKPGGMLVYRTYTIDRMNVAGGPGDPAYLLQPGELRQAFRSLEILHYNETRTGKAAAELVARKG
ncbi:MAG TPA: methyltransferase [Candidatus Angelobacter sp.]|nr:methyltransferase [Candidatus Angelobacter sp.]